MKPQLVLLSLLWVADGLDGIVVTNSTSMLGIQSVVASLLPGDIVQLSSGIFSGPQNCGLNLSVDNITIQGVPGSTTVICSSGEL